VNTSSTPAQLLKRTPGMEVASAATSAARRRFPTLWNQGMQAKTIDAKNAAITRSGRSPIPEAVQSAAANVTYYSWMGVVGFPSLLFGSLGLARSLDNREGLKTVMSPEAGVATVTNFVRKLSTASDFTGLPFHRIHENNIVYAQSPPEVLPIMETGLTSNRIEEVRV
jgi:hypothetical protein